jgi:HPt (histidine-containing phosphotransfer) domain-containing protein
MLTPEDWDEVREVLGDRLDDLAAGRLTGDTRALAREIHSLKGIASAYGLRPVASLFHALEDRLAEGEPAAAAVPPVIEQVRAILEQDAA